MKVEYSVNNWHRLVIKLCDTVNYKTAINVQKAYNNLLEPMQAYYDTAIGQTFSIDRAGKYLDNLNISLHGL